MPKRNFEQPSTPAIEVKQRVRRKLTSAQWDDVADLCNECAVACETAYEEHDFQARKKAATWMMALAMRAQDKANNSL